MTVITIKPMYNPIERTKIPEQPVLKPDMIFEPDEDFYRSISKDELLKGIYEDIDIFFANK